MFAHHVARRDAAMLARVIENIQGQLWQGGKRGLLEDFVAIAANPVTTGAVRDAALIAVAQHLEHDAIASYDCVCQWAGLLGLQDAAGTLALSMAEERRSEARLRRLGESLRGALIADAARETAAREGRD